MSPFHVVIPARYASTRLPGKPLLEIGGKPMVQWVVEAAARSGAGEIVVASDDERIAEVVRDPRRPSETIAVMTGAHHASGTDRIAEVSAHKGWSAETIIVNVQGDEPQIPPQVIDQVAALLQSDADAHMATLCTPITSLREFLDPNVVKVVSAENANALYFSRAPIPWVRDAAVAGLASQTQFAGAQRHLGIYAYRVGVLRSLTRLPPSSLEITEKLEQLRALQAGMRIKVAVASKLPGPGIDTAEDLERIRQNLADPSA
jgi:3-deoxy-manno-octulosonate cytidylyltransferase (CMP-KDO synthetase)